LTIADATPNHLSLKRDRGIAKAVKRWGYSEKEIDDYLKFHYFTVSRLIRKGADSKTSKSKA
jgi:transposase